MSDQHARMILVRIGRRQQRKERGGGSYAHEPYDTIYLPHIYLVVTPLSQRD